MKRFFVLFLLTPELVLPVRGGRPSAGWILTCPMNP